MCVCGFDEFVPVGNNCVCGKVADAAIDEERLFDALILGYRRWGPPESMLSFRMERKFLLAQFMVLMFIDEAQPEPASQ